MSEYERNLALEVTVVIDGRPKYVLAGLAGINATKFSGICSGREVATDTQKQSIARVLNKSVDELFGDNVEIPA